jgi:TRAP-type C4-dicarboxylate transport system substrate-binding protein
MNRFLATTLCALILCAVIGCSNEEAPKGSEQASTKAQQTATAQKQTTPNKSAPTKQPTQAKIPPQKLDPKKASILERWQPNFDPAGAEFTYLLSCIGHPDIEGVAVGFNIRDEVWKRSNGRLYVDYRPLAQLGGERDVLSKLRMGAVHGMLSSSVAAANLDDRLGLVNMPFLIDTPEKLEKFRNDPELFNAFGERLKSRGIIVADFTSYGSYGWASRTPVKTVEEARKVNFRIAQAPVNTELYRAWRMKFTVMPWPDVPQALQTGVIDGLDHTPVVCSISRKFDNVKNFTRVNYAQGLYIHLINLKWLNSLPEELRTILLDVVKEESAKARTAFLKQENAEIEKAKANGVQFLELDATERQKLVEMAQPIYNKWGARIGTGLINRVQNKLDSK